MPLVPPTPLLRLGTSAPSVALASTTWYDLTSRLVSYSVRRGRNYELDRFEAGTARFVCENIDRALEPGHSGSPLYPYVLPMRRIQLLLGENALSANPRFATNTTGWAAYGTNTLTRVTSGALFLGGACGLCTYGNDLRLASSPAPAGLAAGTSYTVTMYVLVPANWDGGNLNLADDGTYAGATITPGTVDVSTCARDTWLRVDATFLLAADTAGAVFLRAASAPTAGRTIRIGAVQVVAGDPQPYTDAATAVFTGYVRGWPLTWDGDYSRVELDCVDGFEVFAAADYTGSPPAEAGGTRIGRILDAVSWPAAERSLDAGASTMMAETLADAVGPKARTALDDVQDAEAGAQFINAAGTYTAHARTRRTSSPYDVSAAAFEDDAVYGTSYPYSDLKPRFDADLVINDVTITKSGGTTYQVGDATSQAAYLRRTYTRTVKTSTDLQASDLASAILARRKDAALRFERIDVDSWLDNAGWYGLLWQALNREISDRITVARTPPAHEGGTSSEVRNDVHIEAVEHRGEPGGGAWLRTAYLLSPVDPTSYFTLDHASRGLLDSGNVFAY